MPLRPTPFLARPGWLLALTVFLLGGTATDGLAVGQGEVTASSPLHIEGLTRASAPYALVYLTSAAPGVVDLGAVGGQGTIHIWTWERYRVQTGLSEHSGAHGFRTTEIPFDRLQGIRLSGGADLALSIEATGRVHSLHAGTSSAGWAAEAHASVDPLRRERADHQGTPFSYHLLDVLALEGHGPASIEADGALSVAFWDAEIEFIVDGSTQVHRAGEWPTGPDGTRGTTELFRKQVIWIELAEAVLAVEWSAGLLTLAPEPVLRVDGLVHTAQASGNLHAPRVRVRDAAFALAGNLTLLPAGASGAEAQPLPPDQAVQPYSSSRWSLSGEILAVWVDGVRLDLAPGIDPRSAAAFSVGSALAALATWRLILPFLVGRVSAEGALSSPTRARLYDIVRSQPGLGSDRIALLGAITLSTAKYHLRILHAARLVTRLRDGRVFRYFENHGKWDDDQRLVSLLAHPKTSLVATTIARAPGLDQARLSDITGLAQSTVSFHLLRLLRNGAVRTERHRGHNVNLYHPTMKLQGTMSRLQEASRGPSGTAVEARA